MSSIRKSLSRRLSLDIILLAVPVFVLSLGVFYVQSRYLIRQEAIERSNSILRTTIQRVSNYMSTVEVSANTNAWLLEENFTPDSMLSISRRIVTTNPHVLSCTVCAEPDMFPQYGRNFSVCSIQEDDTVYTVRETDFEYTERLWYKQPLSTVRACWVDPFSEHAGVGLDHNEAVATYCRPLSSEDGKILGVLATDFSFSRLAETILSTEHPYPDAYFILLGGDGRYLIHPDSTCLFRKTIFTDADPRTNSDRIALGHQMTKGKQGTMHIRINGQRCHVSYQPVPGTDWSLAMVCPDSEVLAGYFRLAYVIIILIIVGLVAILWLCNRVVKQTVTPINKLLGYTQNIASGNYDEVIPRSDQQDDIGRLQNSFATMQQALHDNMGKISHTAEEIRKQNEQRALEMQLAEETIKKKSQFIQNLSHQMRTPLNIIIGFANMLHEGIVSRSQGTPDQETVPKESLSNITETMKYNAIHLKRMVLMLLDSSSTTAAEELMGNRKDEVSCNAVARESIDYTEDHFQGVKIKFETELSDMIHILTNHLYLMRSIRELLYNAAKYSDGKHIVLHVSQTDTTILFTVEDVGPGLPENSDDLLYKPFIKIDDLSEGLGLGLPLTKRHALSLGGDLIYDKSYKDGCRFILELPK